MFFSVKQPIKMFGKKFIPCVCYEATKAMIPTVEKLLAEGKATVYEERVFFQNGAVLKSVAERKAEAKAKEAEIRKAKKEEKKAEIKEEVIEDSDF